MLSGVSTPFSLSPRVNPQLKSPPLPPPPPPPQHHHHALRQCRHHHRFRLVTTLNCSSGESTPSPEKKKAFPLPWSRSLLQFTGDGEKHNDSNASYNNKPNTSNNTVGLRINDSSDNTFLRYYTNSSTADVAAELKTSIVTYKKILPWRLINPNLQVDLVSAVHIADRRYYEILQERLGTYDCVLYEGVGDGDEDEDESHSENDMKGASFTSFLQRLLGWSFSIDFQLDCLNYKFPNWYNADLDWETFQRLQKERGENFLSAAGNALKSAFRTDEDSTSKQSTPDSFKSKLLRVSWFLPMPLAISLIINETCSTDTDDNDDGNKDDFSGLGLRSALKVFIARSLTSMFASELFAEMEEDSVIIGERNKKALEELKKAISRGEKRIAIFYGAGHMPDMGRRLRREFNMVPTDMDWVTAWSIRRAQKTDSKFFTKMGQVGLYGLILCILLLDLWLWWSAANVAYHTGFQMVQFMVPLVIM